MLVESFVFKTSHNWTEHNSLFNVNKSFFPDHTNEFEWNWDTILPSWSYTHTWDFTTNPFFQQCAPRAGPVPGRRVRHGGVRDVARVGALLQALLLLDAQDGAQQVEEGEKTNLGCFIN